MNEQRIEIICMSSCSVTLAHGFTSTVGFCTNFEILLRLEFNTISIKFYSTHCVVAQLDEKF